MKRIKQFFKSTQQQRLLHSLGTSLVLTPVVMIGNAISDIKRIVLLIPKQTSYKGKN